MIQGDGTPTCQPDSGSHAVTYTGAQMTWAVQSGSAATAVFRIAGAPREPMAVKAASGEKLPHSTALEKDAVWL